MKLAYRAYAVTLLLLTLVFAAAAQTPNVSGTAAPTYNKNARSENDPRNTAPTVGTGGPIGGPTGLFTVYDGQTLRKGEWTLSAAISNYDRDPGNVDITDVPLSVQYGLTNRIELFFETNAYRGIKVNSPRNLSSFYLPNSQLLINGSLRSGPAIVLAPQGPGTSQFPNAAVFRPTGTQPFVQFPFVGGSAGTFGFQLPPFSGPIFGFPANTNALITARPGNHGADVFPGMGSVFGSILPGVVLRTTSLVSRAGTPAGEGPLVFALAPSYLPDAPFVNRTWGTSSFNDFTGGVKWRFTGTSNPVGVGIIAYYRWWADHASNNFNMMQRGSGPGGNRGDIGVVGFADARFKKWFNLSANVGYNWNSSVKADFPGGTFTLLDRPDELMASVGADFPVNKWFQPILEYRLLEYVGGQTPNAFRNNPRDFIGGFRVFPARWIGIGVAYRLMLNQQDENSFKSDTAFTTNVIVNCTPPVIVDGPSQTCTPTTISQTFRGIPPGFQPSSDPNGFIFQFFAGRRNKRQGEVINQPANVTGLTLSANTITLGCPPGQVPVSGTCGDSTSINVTTTAVDPENDVLTYQYTVSGGRIVGTGANVSWDLSGVAPGSYTITAGVDDGCGICGKTMTQTVTVASCNCKAACNCPSLTVTGPAGVTAPGGTMTFVANVSGGSQDQVITYNWTVSAGSITSGQGTPSITVAVPGPETPTTNITATVTLGGLDPSCNCPNTQSETAGVSPPPTYTEVDTFGPLSNDDVKARVQSFYVQLANNPNSQGYIINYGTPKQIAARKTQITKAITFLKLDPSRITFVDGPPHGAQIETHFYLVPPGATPPVPQE